MTPPQFCSPSQPEFRPRTSSELLSSCLTNNEVFRPYIPQVLPSRFSLLLDLIIMYFAWDFKASAVYYEACWLPCRSGPLAHNHDSSCRQDWLTESQKIQLGEASEVAPYPKNPKGEKLNNNVVFWSTGSIEPKKLPKSSATCKATSASPSNDLGHHIF